MRSSGTTSGGCNSGRDSGAQTASTLGYWQSYIWGLPSSSALLRLSCRSVQQPSPVGQSLAPPGVLQRYSRVQAAMLCLTAASPTSVS